MRYTTKIMKPADTKESKEKREADDIHILIAKVRKLLMQIDAQLEKETHEQKS